MPNMHFESQIYRILIFLNIQDFDFLTLQQFCQPAYRKPGFTMARAPVFHTIKVIATDLRNCCLEESLFTAHDASFYPLLICFHLQIAYRKVRSLQIGVNKLVGKVLVNLLCHTH